MVLDAVQVRVLGALMEKEIATPETYPLSLNALIAACNQRSSRDPVMELTEEQVRQALHGLEDMGWTAVVRDSRVPKYEHRIRTVLNLRRDETAVLCLLFLRGPQTPGELRSRSERLYSFDGLDVVESTLERMMRRGAPEETPEAQDAAALVTVLPRQPGSRESRYAHLLGGPVAAGAWESSARTFQETGTGHTASTPDDGTATRLAALEAEVAALRAAVAMIEARLGPTLGSAGGESAE
jgi:uncharacterized protein YceH (UPF0502 family)